MHTLIIVLLILAAISFAAAAAGSAFGRINLIGLGLFLFVLSILIPTLQGA
jgi:hypothetical protein